MYYRFGNCLLINDNVYLFLEWIQSTLFVECFGFVQEKGEDLRVDIYFLWLISNRWLQFTFSRWKYVLFREFFSYQYQNLDFNKRSFRFLRVESGKQRVVGRYLGFIYVCSFFRISRRGILRSIFFLRRSRLERYFMSRFGKFCSF